MKFVVMAVVLVCMVGVFHVLFITIDYVFLHPTEGTFTKIQATLNNTWNNETRNRMQNMTVLLRDFFGIGRVVIIAIMPIIFVLTTVRKPKME